MKSARPMLPIPAADLARFVEQATNPIITASWRPGRLKATAQDVGGVVSVEKQQVQPGQSALSVGNEKGLPNEDGVHIVHAIRRGIQIGMFVSESYEKQVRMDELLAKKRLRTLTPEQVV